MVYIPKRSWLCNLCYLCRTMLQLSVPALKRKNKKGKGHRGAQWCSQDIHTYTYIYKL